MSAVGLSLGSTRFVPEGERVLLAIKPHPLFIVLVPLALIGAALVLAGIGVWAISMLGGPVRAQMVWTAAAVLIVLRLAWQSLEWLARTYVLTQRRVIRIGGVLRRYATEVPLHRLQHVTMFQTIRERIFGLGTIGFTTAGTGSAEAYWVMVRRPHELVQRVRRAAADAGPGERPHEAPGHASAPAKPADSPDERQGTRRPRARDRWGPRILSIGLAGGIGAGKSAVARILADLGCVVSDSDRLAKEALDREDVRSRLVGWFGDAILDDSGRIDRRALAERVFSNDAARRRLEGLTHPIVGEIRHRERARAAASGARAFVIDAPLLFEAGVDAECDAVVFVDAPEPARLERLSRERGWDAADVARRGAAQMDLDRKRRMSDYVVVNDADEKTLRRRVERLLAQLEREHRSGEG